MNAHRFNKELLHYTKSIVNILVYQVLAEAMNVGPKPLRVFISVFKQLLTYFWGKLTMATQTQEIKIYDILFVMMTQS